MELNRREIERVLQIAHLDGRVVLTQFIPSRKSSPEVQGNALAAKKHLSFGAKIEEDDKENPLYRVLPTPEGWRIEINDTRIMEELQEKKLAGRKLQTEFVKQFNGQLKQGVLECVWKEKLRDLPSRLFSDCSAVAAVYLFSMYLGLRDVRVNPVLLYGLGTPMIFLFRTAYSRLTGWQKNNRKTDNLLECFMPFVEIDKVLRSVLFLAIKGRKLVKEIS